MVAKLYGYQRRHFIRLLVRSYGTARETLTFLDTHDADSVRDANYVEGGRREKGRDS